MTTSTLIENDRSEMSFIDIQENKHNLFILILYFSW